MITIPNGTLGGELEITLDNNYLVYPQDYSEGLAELNVNTRVRMFYNIISQEDSTAKIKVLLADTILTKPILTYEESILDSLGNDPIIRISGAWFDHGFLNLEFLYSGRNEIKVEHMHMVNLLHHPSEDDKWVFEFRHNAFDDRQEKVYRGLASFPISELLEGVEKPVDITLKYMDSSTSERSIEIIYK